MLFLCGHKLKLTILGACFLLCIRHCHLRIRKWWFLSSSLSIYCPMEHAYVSMSGPVRLEDTISKVNKMFVFFISTTKEIWLFFIPIEAVDYYLEQFVWKIQESTTELKNTPWMGVTTAPNDKVKPNQLHLQVAYIKHDLKMIKELCLDERLQLKKTVIKLLCTSSMNRKKTSNHNS